MRIPQSPAFYGFSGLLPQAAAAIAVLWGSQEIYWIALSAAYFYAATILSFLGGIWWGMAAARSDAPKWVYGVAVVPQLLAFGSAVPWAIGAQWPGPSMVVLAIGLVTALAVDRKLVLASVAPVWWMVLRVPLSLGLGALTLIIAVASS